MDTTSGLSPSSKHIGEEKDGKSTPRRKQTASKLKKAPQAPKNAKTAYLFFSMHMHSEKKLGVNILSKKVPDASKQISTLWKGLLPNERKKWEEMAEKDKLRCKVDKAIYAGPLTVTKGDKRAKKDPVAPRRHMSAFLDYSKVMRSQAIKDNPQVKDNKAISKILGSLWRSATAEEKKPFVNKEIKLRMEYNEKVKVFKTEKMKKLADERMHRDAAVIEAINNGTSNQLIRAAEASRRIAASDNVAPHLYDPCILTHSNDYCTADHSGQDIRGDTEQLKNTNIKPPIANTKFNYGNSDCGTFSNGESHVPRHHITGYKDRFENHEFHRHHYRLPDHLESDHRDRASFHQNFSHGVLQETNFHNAYHEESHAHHYPAPEYSGGWRNYGYTSNNWHHQPYGDFSSSARHQSNHNNGLYSPLRNPATRTASEIGNIAMHRKPMLQRSDAASPITLPFRHPQTGVHYSCDSFPSPIS